MTLPAGYYRETITEQDRPRQLIFTPSGEWVGIVDDSGRDQLMVHQSPDGTALVSGDGTWPLPILPSGDTTGVRDVATIQAVIDAMPSTGGVLRFAAGVFYLASEITVAKTMKIEGAGGGIGGDAGTDPSIAASTINCISQTANGFNVSASGCTFRDFALVNTYAGTPTAGAGIKNTSNTTTTIDAITVLGFYNLLDLAGCYYSVTNCRLYDGVNYYVYHHSLTSPYDDHGDFVVANCVLSGWKKSYVAVAQLRWEGGGGIRVIGNKFNGATQPGNVSAGSSAYCIQCLVRDAITTGSLVISGNSISSKVGTTANVYIGALGPTYNGAFTSVSIVGNEIAVGVLGIVVEGNASYNDKVKGVHIAENIFSFMSSSAVKIRYVRRCHIGQNSHNGATGTDPIIDIPDLTADCQSLSIDKQFIDEAATSRDIIRDNRSIGNTAGALSNGVVYDYTQGLDISTVSTWKQVFKIEVTNQAAGKFTLDIDGRSTDASNTSPNRKGVTWKQERSFDVNGSGAVTLATIGTDYSGGAAAAFINTRFTLTTNYIAVEVQSVDATNCVLWGMARLRVTGKLQRFHIGT